MGGALCRPLRRHRCRDQSRKPWRERPRCARWKWPRACPEGSLTPWLSVLMSVPMYASSAVGSGRDRGADMALIVAHFVRTIWSRSCGNTWSANCTRSARNDAARCCDVRRARSLCASGVHDAATIWTTGDALAITQLMFDLCSAPCKALRFAPPAHARGLRALTVPARRSRIGNYVMAGGVMTLQLDRS